MVKAQLSNSLVVAAILLSGCVTTIGDPGPGPDYLGPAVVDLSPSPGEESFFFEDDLWVRFEFAPDAAQLSLKANDESTVAAASSVSADGTLFTLDPAAALTPDSDYILEIKVTEPDSPPLMIAFRTSQHGLPTHNDTGGLWGAVFRLDTSAALVTEPEEAGPILLNQIENWNILVGFGDESDFTEESQPGVHLQTALGRPGGESFEQDPCGRTVSLTWGPDGTVGTDDDVPATWADPRLNLRPGDIDVLVGAIPSHIGELDFSGLFHPELTDMRDGKVEATIDTRAVDMLFSEEGGQEGITCSLLATLKIGCKECGGDNPGLFCLPMRIERVRATRVAMAPIEPYDCSTVIEHFDATGECAEQIALFDPQGNGSYEACPEYGN